MSVKEFKIVICGNEQVGKSSIFRRYSFDEFTDEFLPSLALDIYLKSLEIGSRNFNLNLYDLSGEKRDENLVKEYIKNAHAALLVFDLTRKLTLLNSDRWLKIFNELKQNNNLPGKFKVILIGNKLDLISSKNKEIRTLAEKFKNKHNFYDYVETSAKTGENIDFCFELLADHLDSIW